MHRALVFLLLFVAPLPAQQTSNDLTAKLVHQTLYLRGFWRSNKLKFDSTGALIGHFPVGSFTTSGFEVEKVTLRPDALELEGGRVGIRFEDDLPERMPLTEGAGSSKVERVRVEIQVPAGGDYTKVLDASSRRNLKIWFLFFRSTGRFMLGNIY